MSWSKKLRDLRIDHDLTRAQMAEIVGVSPKTISRYETGDAEPSISILIQLAMYFKVTTDYICGLAKDEITLDRIVKDEIEQAIEILSKAMKNL